MTPNSDELDCPFCGDHDFDKVGLKVHLESGHCDEYNAIETPSGPRFSAIFAASNGINADRYKTARRMNPRQWRDAWKRNIETGKPFDEIIDELGGTDQ